MSESQSEQPQGEGAAVSEQPAEQPAASVPSFSVQLVQRPTGQTHNVTGQGVVPITDEAGEPEQEYALVADMDGVPVTLASYNFGRLNTVRASEQARQQSQQQQG